MTNLEKMKELKDYEVADLISILHMHVLEVQQATGAEELDAVNLDKDEHQIITSWLNEDFDERKGFKVYLSGGTEYITMENLNHYSFLENSKCDYSEYFEKE